MLLFLAAAVAATPLAPTGPWNVEYSENICSLSRPYGTGASRILVGFQPLFNARSMEVIVVSDPHGKPQYDGTGSLTNRPDGKSRSVGYFSVLTKGGEARFTRLTTTADLFDNLGTIEALTIKARPLDVTIQLTKFDKALPVFRKCQADLLRGWGVDPAALEEANAPKAIHVASRFSPSDYPPAALQNGIFGRVVTLLNVDASGAVTNCRIVATAGPELNEATCAQARKVRYQPAHDAQGRPVPSIDVLAVRWILP